MSAMEVDLLTNALVSNVGPASGGIEPVGGRPIGGSANDSLAGIEQDQAVTADQNQIDASGNLASEKPSKDFAETLEGRIQAEAAETAQSIENSDNTETADAAAMGSQSLPEQSEFVPSQEPAHLAGEMGKLLIETANQPQQEAVAENPELVTMLSGSTDSQPAIAQTETQVMTPGLQLSEQIIELEPEQGQIQSNSAQLSQGQPAVAESLQIAQIAQVDGGGGSNEDSAPEQGTPVEGKTEELLNESLGQGGRGETLTQKAANAAGQTASNAAVALTDKPDGGKEASSNTQGESSKAGPNITASAFSEAESRVDDEQQTKTLPQAPEDTEAEVFGDDESGTDESPAQKLNTKHFESVAVQSNSRQVAASDANNSLDPEHAVPPETPQASVPERPVSIQAPNAPASAPPGDNAAAVGEQIRESITSSRIGPDQEITIRLNPPELGTVVVKFQEQDDQITGLLEVSKAQTRAEIQQLLPEITRDLQDFGVQIKRIEVVMAAEQENETLSGQSAMAHDDRWGGQEGPGGSEANAPRAPIGEVFAQNSPYAGSTSSYSQSYITDKAIDMFA